MYLKLIIILIVVNCVLSQEIRNRGFKEFNRVCNVPGSNERGQLIKEKFCPASQQQKLPRACPYEICDNIVCCPDSSRLKLVSTCFNENPERWLIERLHSESRCTVEETNKPGFYKRIEECPIYSNKGLTENDIGRVCDWTICANYICCPEEYAHEITCSGHFPPMNDIVLDVGEPCVHRKTNVPGTCMSLGKCLSIKDESDVQICGKTCCSKLICCPNPDLSQMRISDKACAGYRFTPFEEIHRVEKYIPPNKNIQPRCGIVSPAGGFAVSPGEFPHFALLGYEAKNASVYWDCGGTLISEIYVLTAGHCLYSKKIESDVTYARFDITNIIVNVHQNDESDCVEEFKIQERIPHPNFKTGIKYNDIALLKLDRNVQFNLHVRPACLYTKKNLPPNVKYTAVGFGFTGWDAKKKTEKLLKVHLDYFNHRECNEKYKASINRKFRFGVDDETQFCAGSRDSIQDTCPGDSGGPIQLKGDYHGGHDDYYYMAVVVGVTSFGKSCGFQNSPAIYTRIYPYLSWIEGIVWPTMK